MSPWLLAFIICAAAAVVEGLCAGRDPMRQLGALKQPHWSPPAWVWVLIGLAWYGICYAALVRLLPSYPDAPWPVRLLVLLMLANAAANLVQFRMRRLDLAFMYLFPYWLLLAAFIWAAAPIDGLTVLMFSLYAIYQLYAAAWGWRLWQMNRGA